MTPKAIKEIDQVPESAMYDAVQKLSVADIEEISISDISALDSRPLKDLLNHAVSDRLAQHMGGTYTSPPKASIAEINS
ncbi:hypothetical protein AR457_37040 [Streptomyces agglomeratus]|uniref:Uncharacterized protein n=1 Tax=Streptomyces agglomeratus TaxID=285458 RepID=A0A1E5NYQ6_9ACTN|nr:hypothetical protein [Streptomyces agglomeratus]OEJ21418.1 hypothetical protein AS594_38255 [Streptomyces agglomeratus]OEJ22853.1 hypothetical protein AR457_37040 [Streptomyces agglomeratus]